MLRKNIFVVDIIEYCKLALGLIAFKGCSRDGLFTLKCSQHLSLSLFQHMANCLRSIILLSLRFSFFWKTTGKDKGTIF